MRETGFIKPNKACHIIGVAGGSGSGKTYFASALRARLGHDLCEIVYQDSFYHDQSARFDFDGGSVNFDHPDSIDFGLLASKVGQLKAGQAAEIPVYDFKTHARLTKTERIENRPVIMVDGILIFHWPEVRRLFDDLIFFDTPEDLRFRRRLERDVHERGRTAEGVRNQFFKQVKPMHDAYVEPTKAFAKTVVRDAGHFESVLDHYARQLSELAD
jgi:uridine kinase